MGGFESKYLGNASPRTVDLECSMGGAEIDLRGLWRQDCDLRLATTMGGMEVQLPDDVRVEGLVDPDSTRRLQRTDLEVSLPVLRVAATSSMGEVVVE